MSNIKEIMENFLKNLSKMDTECANVIQKTDSINKWVEQRKNAEQKKLSAPSIGGESTWEPKDQEEVLTPKEKEWDGQGKQQEGVNTWITDDWSGQGKQQSGESEWNAPQEPKEQTDPGVNIDIQEDPMYALLDLQVHRNTEDPQKLEILYQSLINWAKSLGKDAVDLSNPVINKEVRYLRKKLIENYFKNLTNV